LSVAGQKNWSTTTHTFFVEKNAVNDKDQDFETILGIETVPVSRAEGHENENLSTELPVEAPATILE
jgi:hypothetical protein